MHLLTLLHQRHLVHLLLRHFSECSNELVRKYQKIKLDA